ncbi:hypothetical protein JM658_04530 [Joostella atrarenae]|uniref:Uncharacterized protein n=1 Tax=Joostella atrarenae TaxID=679257 RepID=A0ABS9J0Z8_9FLAO|nr:DUF6607 family protein [Joostella atrarenae]MCF8714087.1 hypothetical protein [Joostella atrarenae]
MKKLTLILGLTLSMTSLSTIAQGNKKAQDQENIKDMCGCYEVRFNFAETFNNAKDSTYQPSKVKQVGALEWVELVEDKSDKIVMQHLLIANDTMIIKHWRQDWLYENTDLYMFNKDKKWNFEQLSKEEVKGQWTQKVYQVDDSPRYEGSATWVHVDGKNYWVNTTDAPLPRREHTIRDDYNVTKRRNIHAITDYGWLHEQDNDKIVRDDNGNDFVLAQEKGYDTYTKVADSKCKAAQDWWKDNKKFWKVVRNKWQDLFDENKDIELKKSVDNKPLFAHLFSMPPNSSKKEIEAVIDSFIVK